MGARFMEWFARDFDLPAYFEIYQDKEREAATEGPGLAALLALPAGSRILDLPCGWGRLRPALQAAGLRVVGGDLSALNLARHQREFPGLCVRLDLRRLPFRDGSADGVLCAYTSWGYFASEEDNRRQLREFSRVLRPGGVLVLDLAGRERCFRNLRLVGGGWYDVQGRYRERVRASADGRRILTERICRGVRFRHDIWIPADREVRTELEAAGLDLDRAFGGVDGGPWSQDAERWVYRATKRAFRGVGILR
jgi:SAM-dependent methyltransferase